MAKREEDESFELQQKRWTELINLRQAMIDHKMDAAGVELAISNVFDPKKGRIIESMTLDGQKLMATILRLEELQIDPSNVKMTLEKAFVPGMNGAYDSDLLRLKGMIEMREEMAAMGIPTGCVEVSISEVFKPLSAAVKTVKSEELSEASATKPVSPTAGIIQPVELDASPTAIFNQSTAEIGKPAELDASETAITMQSSSSTEAGKPVESPARLTEMRPVSKDTETDKPAEVPSQPTSMKPPSSDVEHIAIIGTSIEAIDLDSSSATTSSPLAKAPSVSTSPSTVRSAPSTKTSSSLNRPSTPRPTLSAKRSAPTDTEIELGSAQNPICLGSSPAPPKRQRTVNDVASRADPKTRESWKVPIESVGIMGLHLKPRYDDADLSIAFDVVTQRVVFYKGQQSLTALYPGLEIVPEALLSVTRPAYTQSKQLRVRFTWLDTDAEESFLDIMIATKQDCRVLIARLKNLTSFSEILLPEPRMNRLYEDATWVVNETHNAFGVSVTKFSENVWLD